MPLLAHMTNGNCLSYTLIDPCSLLSFPPLALPLSIAPLPPQGPHPTIALPSTFPLPLVYPFPPTFGLPPPQTAEPLPSSCTFCPTPSGYLCPE